MKILTYTTLYPNNVNPNHGVFIKERMTRAAEHCELRVVAPVPYFPAWKRFKRWYAYSQISVEEKRDGLGTYHPRYLVTPKVGMNLYGWLMYRSTIGMVQRIYEDSPFDLIDAHYVYPDGVAATLIGQKLGVPVVLSARGTDINLFPKFPMVRRQICSALRKCAHAIAVSQALKTRICELGISEQRVTVVPNGVDTAKFFQMPQMKARDSLGLPHGRYVVLSVGGLVENKGFQHLILALHALCQVDPKPLLVIVGEGPYRVALEALIQDLGLGGDVILAGARPHAELVEWYNAADVFCLASSREGWPNVLFEALACGKPVVATKVGGIPEVICSPEYGSLVDGALPQAFADAIRATQVAKWNPERIAAYAQRNTWDNVASKVVTVFEDVLDGKRKE